MNLHISLNEDTKEGKKAAEILRNMCSRSKGSYIAKAICYYYINDPLNVQEKKDKRKRRKTDNEESINITPVITEAKESIQNNKVKVIQEKKQDEKQLETKHITERKQDEKHDEAAEEMLKFVGLFG